MVNVQVRVDRVKFLTHPVEGRQSRQKCKDATRDAPIAIE